MTASWELNWALCWLSIRCLASYWAGLLSEMCVSATARAALEQGLPVVLPRDAHTTYDIDDLPARSVARAAEHAL